MDDQDTSVADYDPALAETIEEGDADEEVAVIARLSDPAALPAGVRVVTRFGDIVTLRIRRDQIAGLAAEEAVVALELSRELGPADADEPDAVGIDGDGGGRRPGVDAPAVATTSADLVGPAYQRRPAKVRSTGRGVVIAVLDWGLDFAFPSLREDDRSALMSADGGRTRLLALWDQRGTEGSGAGNRWGYGRVFGAEEIDRALGQDDPYAALRYHPGDADSFSRGLGDWVGSHGTHVADIAAGNGRGGGATGVAPDASLIFVHLAHTTQVLGAGNLGDSVTLLEALDFAFATAGDRPCVVNMSVGAHGGPHDGTTLVEQGIDRSLWLGGGRAAVVSAGNYYTQAAHAQGRVSAGGEVELPFKVPAADPTVSEIEIWYPGIDRFTATVVGPSGTSLATVEPGQNAELSVDGAVVGRVHHVRQASNADHHVDLFLKPFAPDGTWKLRLKGDRVNDGRYHAWIERERGYRPQFLPAGTASGSTTGTLCNGRLSIAVGAYDPHRAGWPLGRFSSAGPTRDGRVKPEIAAPGVRIRAGRSAPPGAGPGARYTTKGGTSMAAPHVAGAIAVMFAASSKRLEISDTRALLFASADRTAFAGGAPSGADVHRLGSGYLDVEAAERAAEQWSGMASAEPPIVGDPIDRKDVVDEMTDVQIPEATTVEQLAEASWGNLEEEKPEVGAAEKGAEDVGAGEAEAALDEEAAFDEEAAPAEEGAADEAEFVFSDGDYASWDVEGDEFDAVDDQDESPSWERRSDVQRERLRMLAEGGDPIAGAGSLHELAFSAMGVALDDELSLVAAPASVLTEPVQPGDLLVRSDPSVGLLYSSVVLSDEAEPADLLALRGVPVEAAGPGAYVEVMEANGGEAPRTVGRRLTDAWGRTPHGQSLMRPASAVDGPAPSGWSTTEPSGEGADDAGIAEAPPERVSPAPPTYPLEPEEFADDELELEIMALRTFFSTYAGSDPQLRARIEALEKEVVRREEALLTNFERRIRGGSTKYAPVPDPDTGRTIGYYRYSGGYEEIRDREGHVIWADEPGLTTPLLDPIDFLPSPRTVIKGGAAIGTTLFGRLGAKGGRSATSAAAKALAAGASKLTSPLLRTLRATANAAIARGLQVARVGRGGLLAMAGRTTGKGAAVVAKGLARLQPSARQALADILTSPVARRSLAAAGDDIVRAINRFHGVQGFKQVVANYVAGGNMQKGARFVMRYTEARFPRIPKQFRFEFPHGRRRIMDLVADDVRYEFKSVAEVSASVIRGTGTGASIGQMQRDLTRLLSQEPFNSGKLKWVFDATSLAGQTKADVVRTIRGHLRGGIFRSHPRSKAVSGWIDDIVELWPKPVRGR